MEIDALTATRNGTWARHFGVVAQTLAVSSGIKSEYLAGSVIFDIIYSCCLSILARDLQGNLVKKKDNYVQ